MSNPIEAWWKLAQSMGEIAWHSPQVMQHRTARLLSSRGLTRAADRREATRMVNEKFETMIEAQMAMWQHGLTLQQRALQDFWRMALSGRPLRGSAVARRGALASFDLARRGLQPVRTRVKANSRRLSSR